MDIKKLIIDCFDDQIKSNFNLSVENISVPPNNTMGDFCMPCFTWVKSLKKSPVEVAKDLTQNFNYSGVVEKTEVVGGYLNFFLNKKVISLNVLAEILASKENFGRSDEGLNKTVCLDFSSVNLAKYMHIGHLSTTVIGNCLRNLHNFLGYNTVAINYVGDYGTPFGKMITAYKLWGNETDLNAKGVDYIQDLYIKFCQEAENNKELDEQARICFAKIEKKDPEVYPIYEKFIKISIDETQKIYSLLNIKFDSWRGESYYSDKMDPIVNELDKKGLLQDSNGAKIVDLGDYNLGACLIRKSDGSSLYATRDLAACDDRYKNYNFFKSLYVTDVSQKLHFSQFFKVLDLLGRDYANSLHHVFYGRFSLPDGKIASRKGKQAILRDILSYSINKTRNIVESNENLSDEEKAKISTSVGVGAVVFSAIKNEKIKDVVFDIDEALDFNGETSPYIQYTRARCCSIIKKSNSDKDCIYDLDFDQINNPTSYELLKTLNRFPDTVKFACEKFEPCYVSRILIDISKAFNKYYSSNRVVEDGKVNKTRLALVEATKIVLTVGLKLLGIDALDKM